MRKGATLGFASVAPRDLRCPPSAGSYADLEHTVPDHPHDNSTTTGGGRGQKTADDGAHAESGAEASGLRRPPGTNMVFIVCVAHVIGGELDLSDELVDARWFALDALPDWRPDLPVAQAFADLRRVEHASAVQERVPPW